VSALVTPAWLQERLGDPHLRIIESSTDRAMYDEGHIPGAQWIDPYGPLLIDGDNSRGNVITPRQFAELMSRLSIEPATTVVFYGNGHSRYAMRGHWTLGYYRHPGAFDVLDGGRERWIAEGRPLTADVVEPAATPYPEPRDIDRSDEASWEDVRDAIGQRDALIVDVRTPGEYEGSDVRSARGGHIPGAVHFEYTDATAADNVLRPPDELRRMFEERGITPDKEIIAHCQLGVRAAHTWFVLKHVLGYPNVKNYDGSWSEWGNRDDLPIER
jgi:thiosulfate/3-mercaptopyruvate sulfurtransferase